MKAFLIPNTNSISQEINERENEVSALWEQSGVRTNLTLDSNNYKLSLNLYNKYNDVLSTQTVDTIVETDRIIDSAVTTEKIKDFSVITNKIQNLSVTSEKIADEAVITKKLSNSSVTSDKIGTGAVNFSKLSTSLANKILTLENQAFTNVTYDSITGVLQFTSVEGIQKSIDLPLELITSGGYYDDTKGDEAIVLVLANGDEIRIPVADLLSELIDYINGIREKIYVLQEAPPISALSSAILLCTPTLAQIAGLN